MKVKKCIPLNNQATTTKNDDIELVRFNSGKMDEKLLTGIKPIGYYTKSGVVPTNDKSLLLGSIIVFCVICFFVKPSPFQQFLIVILAISFLLKQISSLLKEIRDFKVYR